MPLPMFHDQLQLQLQLQLTPISWGYAPAW